MTAPLRTPATRPSLLVRLRDGGDEAAWREFDQAYRELILRYARHRGLQQADAEDVRQQVLLALSRALLEFRYDPARGRFRDYLGRVVRHAAIRQMRRPIVVSSELDGLGDAPTGNDEQDPLWEREWMLHHLRRAMSTVRRAFEPRSIEVFDALLAGSEVATVAAAHGLSPQAVHKIKQRIRDRLRELIAEQLKEEAGADG